MLQYRCCAGFARFPPPRRPGLLHALIQRSAWKGYSRNFVLTELSEVAPRTSRVSSHLAWWLQRGRRLGGRRLVSWLLEGWRFEDRRLRERRFGGWPVGVWLQRGWLQGGWRLGGWLLEARLLRG